VVTVVVVDLGITHIDTSDAYGPHVTNRLIREALHPYPHPARSLSRSRRSSNSSVTD
jgi:pyridoxine 4-dehydrogenase